jgi:hypothetical protein
MPSVLQNWVQDLTFMQQSVLLTAIRGCDGITKYHPSKFVLRWLRRCVMYSAFTQNIINDPYLDDGGNFTGKIPRDKFPTIEALFKCYLDNVDEIAHHFHMHLVHAAEILGYKHPDKSIKADWLCFYLDCCRDLHMSPESRQQMDLRLGDSRENWINSGRETIV